MSAFCDIPANLQHGFGPSLFIPQGHIGDAVEVSGSTILARYHRLVLMDFIIVEGFNGGAGIRLTGRLSLMIHFVAFLADHRLAIHSLGYCVGPDDI